MIFSMLMIAGAGIMRQRGGFLDIIQFFGAYSKLLRDL